MAQHTAVMSADSFKAARHALGLSQAELSLALDTPRRTIQDWESGVNRVPGVARVALELLQQKDRWVMAAIKTKIEHDLDRRYPNGLVSVPDSGFAEGVRTL